LIQIVIEHKKQLHNPCIVLSLALFWAVTSYVSHSNSSLTPDFTTVALPAGEALQRKKGSVESNKQ
jgi:hypothetical protein